MLLPTPKLKNVGVVPLCRWPVAVKRVNEELAKERNEVKVRCQDTREDDSVGVACSLNCLRQLSTCIDDVTSLSPSVKPR